MFSSLPFAAFNRVNGQVVRKGHSFGGWSPYTPQQGGAKPCYSSRSLELFHGSSCI